MEFAYFSNIENTSKQIKYLIIFSIALLVLAIVVTLEISIYWILSFICYFHILALLVKSYFIIIGNICSSLFFNEDYCESVNISWNQFHR